MSEPTTEAGRALAYDPDMQDDAPHPHPDFVTECWICLHIAAIEAEARAAVLAELRAKVEALQGVECYPGDGFEGRLVHRAAVLDLLAPV